MHLLGALVATLSYVAGQRGEFVLQQMAEGFAKECAVVTHYRLRSKDGKIEVDPAHPDSIRTVRGVGYMFVPPKD